MLYHKTMIRHTDPSLPATRAVHISCEIQCLCTDSWKGTCLSFSASGSIALGDVVCAVNDLKSPSLAEAVQAIKGDDGSSLVLE